MNYRAWVIGITAAILSIAGCDRKVGSSKSYALKGVVRKVEPGSGEVTIAHEAIEGFMPRMTMPFLVKDKALIAGIKPGDEVEGTLKVDSEGGDVKALDLVALKVVGHEAEPPEESAPAFAVTRAVLQPGEVVPDFAMTTQAGGTLKLADLKGKVVVLTFIYTRCPSPEFCPAMDLKFAELARRIGASADRTEEVRLLSVSFDPEHDTPEVLRAHAARRGAKPPLWTFAVASHQELAKVAGPLGLAYIPGTREIDHNLRAAVIGPDGRLALIEVGKDWRPADLLKTIYGLIPDRRK